MNNFLQSISLTQFKNYNNRHFDFNENIICITGNNGKGKTNLLDAIYYLCFTKSYFNNQDSLNIQYEYDGFRIEGHFLRNNKEDEVVCTLRQGKKEILLNGESYSRLSRHIGHFPAVIIAPDDAILINGGSEQRRRFLDGLLTQMDVAYLDDLMAYQKILQQRNSFLKNLSEERKADMELFSVFDSQLNERGHKIFEKRKNIFPALKNKVNILYQEISQSEENIDLQYQSALFDGPLHQILLQNRQRDILLQRTTDGIHRDDLVFFLNGHPFKQTASQGQRKNFLFALKLAQYDLLQSSRHISPLLLLDDIFEKLDHQRISHLINLISQPGFGQVFITDTEEERIKKIWGEKKGDLQFVKL